MTCQRSQEFLADQDVAPAEQVFANKQRLGPSEALALARSARRVIALRGKKAVTLELAAEPSDAELLAVLLGPTGMLRAPAARIGDTLLVGFDPATYAQLLQGQRPA